MLMDMMKIGLLLELIGFSLIAFFAGILLEKGFTKRISSKIEGLIFMIASKIDIPTKMLNVIPMVKTPEMDNIEFLSSLKTKKLGNLSLEIALYLIVWVYNILPVALLVWSFYYHVFWLSVLCMIFALLTYSFFTFLFFSLSKLDAESNNTFLQDLWLWWATAFWVIVFHLTVVVFGTIIPLYSIFELLLLAFFFSLKIIQWFLLTISGYDVLKKFLIIMGTIIVLVGLSLQISVAL